MASNTAVVQRVRPGSPCLPRTNAGVCECEGMHWGRGGTAGSTTAAVTAAPASPSCQGRPQEAVWLSFGLFKAETAILPKRPMGSMTDGGGGKGTSLPAKWHGSCLVRSKAPANFLPCPDAKVSKSGKKMGTLCRRKHLTIHQDQKGVQNLNPLGSARTRHFQMERIQDPQEGVGARCTLTKTGPVGGVNATETLKKNNTRHK